MPETKEKKETAAARPFVIRGAADEPIEVPAGEYYFNTKARARRMMLNSLSADARRVYACLELATMGYQQELAVTLERGRPRPLTPADVCDQTGLSRQHVRAGLRELETAGLAQRRAQDGGPLRKGQMMLYCWATPRRPGDKNCSRAQLQFPHWFPEGWEPLKHLITRRKLLNSLDEATARNYIPEGEEIARSYQEIEIRAARFLERVCAPASHKEEERTERTVERKNPPPPPPPSESPQKPPQDDEEDFSNQSPQNTNTQTPLPALPVAPEPNAKATPPPTTSAPPPPPGPSTAKARAADKFPENAGLGSYPRVDAAKAAAVWKKMPAAERQEAVAALPKYLLCERWLKQPRFIPNLSTWLKEERYKYEPEKFFEVSRSRDATSFGLPSADEAKRLIDDATQAEDRRRAARRNGGKQ